MDALGINLGFLLAQIFNFLLIFFLLAKGVWPKVLNMLDARQEKIAKGLEDARAAEEARANAEREREQLLAGARAESQRILDEARQRGEEQSRAILRDAQHEAEDRRTQAHSQAEEERNRILSESREQIVALAMAAAERVLGQSLDAAQQRAVIKRFFVDVPAGASSLGDHVEVTSALPLTDEEQAQIRKATGASEVDFQVNPSILGGLILRSGDKVVDGSVRGDMTALAARLR
ncbi:F0F1 ATP synthase subunit B [Aggregatilinea lenta]|uniref:F0F1 ATP synthase subunit B n=1 Tax=Aggregatilinea lenta TaxID=913108 RepID=UPI000E5BD96D|nr:F0F1 ATP synthase subunit B [Aggregatilinea lenta]